jgi:hypothetical protein
MAQRELFAEAIWREPDCEEVWNFVARMLDSPDFFTLRDGRKMDRRHLLLEAVRLCYPAASSLIHLGNLLMLGEVVTLPDGQVLDRIQLHLLAVRRLPNAQTYSMLAAAVGKDGAVALGDGHVMTQRQLYFEALRLPGRAERLLADLAGAMNPHEVVTLPCGLQADSVQLLVESLKRDPHLEATHSALSKALEESATQFVQHDCCHHGVATAN